MCNKFSRTWYPWQPLVQIVMLFHNKHFDIQHVHVSCFIVKWKNRMGIGNFFGGRGGDTLIVSSGGLLMDLDEPNKWIKKFILDLAESIWVVIGSSYCMYLVLIQEAYIYVYITAPEMNLFVQGANWHLNQKLYSAIS